MFRVNAFLIPILMAAAIMLSPLIDDARAQTRKPDFSGTWRLDVEASDDTESQVLGGAGADTTHGMTHLERNRVLERLVELARAIDEIDVAQTERDFRIFDRDDNLRIYYLDGKKHARQMPWGTKLDGKVQPELEVPCVGNGIPRSRLVHKDGWTALGFWDRTVDTRGASCGAFVSDGTRTETDMLADAQAFFPEVWVRLHRNRGTHLVLRTGASDERSTVVANCTQCPVLRDQNNSGTETCSLDSEQETSANEVPLRCPLRRLRVQVCKPPEPKA